MREKTLPYQPCPLLTPWPGPSSQESLRAGSEGAPAPRSPLIQAFVGSGRPGPSLPPWVGLVPHRHCQGWDLGLIKGNWVKCSRRAASRASAGAGTYSAASARCRLSRGLWGENPPACRRRGAQPTWATDPAPQFWVCLCGCLGARTPPGLPDPHTHHILVEGRPPWLWWLGKGFLLPPWAGVHVQVVGLQQGLSHTLTSTSLASCWAMWGGSRGGAVSP